MKIFIMDGGLSESFFNRQVHQTLIRVRDPHGEAPESARLEHYPPIVKRPTQGETPEHHRCTEFSTANNKSAPNNETTLQTSVSDEAFGTKGEGATTYFEDFKGQVSFSPVRRRCQAPFSEPPEPPEISRRSHSRQPPSAP